MIKTEFLVNSTENENHPIGREEEEHEINVHQLSNEVIVEWENK